MFTPLTQRCASQLENSQLRRRRGTQMAKFVLSVVAVSTAASSAMGATSGYAVDGSNTIAGTVANVLLVDSEGPDWTAEVLLVELTAGSVHNAASNDAAQPQPGLWGSFPELQWDSFVGVPGDPSGSIAGGAGPAGSIGNFGVVGGSGDLDGDGVTDIKDLNLVLSNWNQTVMPGDPSDPNGDGFVAIDDLDVVFVDAATSAEGLLGPSVRVSATWFNTNTSDTGAIQTGTITLSDDAFGTWSRITAFKGGLLIEDAGAVANGAFTVPEPTALVLVCGFLAALTACRQGVRRV